MSWAPILDGVNKAKAIEIIAFIKKSTPSQYYDSSLMYGRGGLLIWLAYLSKYDDDIAGIEREDSLFNKVLEEILDSSETQYSFGKGSLGTSWALAHLIKNGFVSEEGDIFSNVSGDFETISSEMIDEGNYDYMLAGLGALLFFIETGKQKSAEIIFQRLKNNAIAQIDGITWKESPIVRNSPSQGINYNLGLAHGVPGIMSIISLFHTYIKTQLKDDSRATILKISNWLLSLHFDFPNSSARFPFSFGDNETPFPTSIRWCYGDLGIAHSLYLSGINIGDKRLKHEGIELAKRCIGRNSESQNIVDAHLCHGTAGIAHIYNRFYNSSHENLFKDAATFWFEETFRKFNPKFEFGFQAWKGEQYGWQDFPGLLEGSAGIGLALSSAISEVEPKWDRCLLLS